jgi:uncharacterized protein YecE (DUF72 family)
MSLPAPKGEDDWRSLRVIPPHRAARPYDPRVAAPVRIGTCSFADKALLESFYPKGVKSSAERLAYYSARFTTVEVDSTYYRLPDAETSARWAQRTPDGFVFHIKAFGMMTRHPVRLEQVPPDLREAVEVDARGRVERPSRGVRAEVFSLFHAGLEPLRAAGKLGGVLLQFPSYVVPKAVSDEYLGWAVERLAGDLPLVEFRHRDWLGDGERARTLALLEELGAAFVVTDSPRIEGAKNLVPTVVATTAPVAYVRFHGRNAKTWNVRGGSAAERFDYLYSEDELGEWVEPLRELAGRTEQVYAFFNNNAQSQQVEPDPGGGAEWVAQAPTNAVMLRSLLEEAGVPVG